jgi:hypothetical protein
VPRLDGAGPRRVYRDGPDGQKRHPIFASSPTFRPTIAAAIISGQLRQASGTRYPDAQKKGLHISW